MISLIWGNLRRGKVNLGGLKVGSSREGSLKEGSLKMGNLNLGINLVIGLIKVFRKETAALPGENLIFVLSLDLR